MRWSEVHLPHVKLVPLELNVDKSTDNQTDRIKTIWGKGYLFVKDVW